MLRFISGFLGSQSPSIGRTPSSRLVKYRHAPDPGAEVGCCPTMKHSVHRPPEALREYVELFWTMEAYEQPAGLMFKTCATTACAVVFQHHDGRSALQPRVSRDERGQPNDHCDDLTVFALGIVMSQSHTMAIGAFSATGAVFTPQALHRLFKVDAFELTDTPLDLVAFATPNLNERLINATRQEGRLALFSEFLRV